MNVRRLMHDPPDEQYEITWREAKDLLEEIGPDGGFILLTVRDTGEEWFTRYALSSGADQIATGVLKMVAAEYLKHV